VISRLIEIRTANPSKIHSGQEVLHGDPRRLDYYLGDIHTLTLEIKEDIEFIRGIIVKVYPGKFSGLQTELISSVCTLETNSC
jgi:hypothetical protein